MKSSVEKKKPRKLKIKGLKEIGELKDVQPEDL